MIILVLLILVLYGMMIHAHLELDRPNLFMWVMSLLLSTTIISTLFTCSLFLNLSFSTFITVLSVAGIAIGFYFNKVGLKNIKLPLRVDYYLLGYAAVLLIGTYMFMNEVQRWGGWDAWAIWNLHAKFLVATESWTNLFTERLNWSHPDYPLMLPSIVALFWKVIGSTHVLVPIVIAYTVFISILSFIYTGLREQNGGYIGILGMLILVLDPTFITKASSQYADTLLALCILLPTMLLSTTKNKTTHDYLLAGVFASLCFWVKNEGMVFFVLISVLVGILNVKSRKNLVNYFKAIIPILIIFILFKFIYAPSNDLISKQGDDTIDKLLSMVRYQFIGSYLLQTVLKQYMLLPLALVIIIVTKPSKQVVGILLVLLTTFLVYLGAYLVSPYGLEWHIKTSLDRLIHQLYPSLLFLALLGTTSAINRRIDQQRK